MKCRFQRICRSGIALCISFFLFQNLFAQDLAGQIDLGKNFPRDLNAQTNGDSIIVSFVSANVNSNKTNFEIHAIGPDGKGTGRTVNALKKKDVLASVFAGDTIRIYYLEKGDSGVALRYLKVSDRTGEVKEVQRSVLLPGVLLASYQENGNLILICSSKKDYMLRCLVIKDAKLLKDTKFKLSFDPLSSRRAIAFIQHGHPVNLSQAAAPIKIFQRPDKLIITVDENGVGAVSSKLPFKTIVSILNMNSGTVSTRAIMSQEPYFNSFVYGKHLFQVNSDQKFIKLKVTDVNTGAETYSQYFAEPKGSLAAVSYTRDELESDVSMQVIKSPLKGMKSFVVADSVNGKIELMIGHYVMRQNVTLPVPSLTSAVLNALSSAIFISSLTSPAEISATYTYAAGSFVTGFKYINRSSFAQQRLDDYEVANRIKRLKQYVVGLDAVYSIYRGEGNHVLSFHRFSGL